ncbi:MAG: hypothetical protein AMXMBFR44_3280 [Candidatus Campbellbacteria bacterium]
MMGSERKEVAMPKWVTLTATVVVVGISVTLLTFAIGHTLYKRVVG